MVFAAYRFYMHQGLTRGDVPTGGGGGGAPLFGLNRYVALKRVWFSGSCVLNRVYNFTI